MRLIQDQVDQQSKM